MFCYLKNACLYYLEQIKLKKKNDLLNLIYLNIIIVIMNLIINMYYKEYFYYSIILLILFNSYLLIKKTFKKMKTAFICFFPVFPTNMGSAEVIRSLFLCWPGQKKLFQISHLNNNNKKIFSH